MVFAVTLLLSDKYVPGHCGKIISEKCVHSYHVTSKATVRNSKPEQQCRWKSKLKPQDLRVSHFLPADSGLEIL